MILYQKKDNVNNTWAEKEIKRAIELADPDYIPRKVGFIERALEKIGNEPLKKDEFLGYETACYLTAINAFHEIESGEVGNTGLIRDTLIRLMDGLPLTPIDDDPETWINMDDERGWKYPTHTVFRSTRYFHLYKIVLKNGEVRYEDARSVLLVDDSEKVILKPLLCLENGFYNNPAEIIVNELFPISLPYIPSKEQFKVVCFYSDDLFWVKRIIDKSGNAITVNRYYQLILDAPKHMAWVEIGKTKYYRRLKNKGE